jgi:uncharacterized membrane protein YdjX (TVP38/TMEM64 family)
MTLPNTRGSAWRAVLLATVLLAAAAAWKAGLFSVHDTSRLRALVEGLRATPAFPVVFVVGYAILSAIGVPVSPLTLIGGALFGTTLGIALNWMGELSGALLAFGIVRTLSPRGLGFRRPVEGSLSKNLGANAPVTLFRLRVIPVAPFALLNAGAALSGMSWRSYSVATALGIIPLTVIYTLFAASLISGVAGSSGRALFTALASAAGIIALTFVRRRTSREANSQRAEGGG